MKIHVSKAVTAETIFRAVDYAQKAGHGAVDVMEPALPESGSRSHAHGFNVKLVGDGSHSRRRVNVGTSQEYDRFSLPYAASWESWGWLLGYLFQVDPTMVTPYDKGADAFHARTKDAFHVYPDEIA